MIRKYIVASLLFGSTAVFSQVGADALLQATNTEDTTAGVKNESLVGDSNPFAKFKIDDPFLIHMFSTWKNVKGIGYEANQWLMTLFRNEFEKAAHLITAIEKHFPEANTYDFIAAKLYLYYRLDLGQTFVDEYLSYSQDNLFRSTKAFKALHEATRKLNVFDWVVKLAPTISADKLDFVKSVDPKKGLTLENALLALSLQRSGEGALKVINYVPPGHEMMVPLVRTIVLDYARKGNVAEAGKVLKHYLEPSIKKNKNPDVLTKHLLMIARLLYQVGVLDASQDYYEKVPKSSDDMLTARTELLWVLLRKGDTARLRGELASLGHELFDGVFNPEVYLVRAISNLKLCQYAEVDKDFRAFVKSNIKWAGVISKKLKQSDPKIEGYKNYFVRLAEKKLQRRQAEKQRLDQLAQLSIKAALPAVGKQPHWTNASQRMVSSVEESKKELSTYSRMFWKNRKMVLKEAIRKMRFVKLETLDQLRDFQVKMAQKGQSVVSDSVKTRLSGLEKQEKMVFKFDGVMWPDEVFNLYSGATTQCLAQGK